MRKSLLSRAHVHDGAFYPPCYSLSSFSLIVGFKLHVLVCQQIGAMPFPSRYLHPTKHL